jgi:hypothetical protein
MSVKIDESGRRWVAVEVEVPGTPEQVWHAIAIFLHIRFKISLKSHHSSS